MLGKHKSSCAIEHLSLSLIADRAFYIKRSYFSHVSYIDEQSRNTIKCLPSFSNRMMHRDFRGSIHIPGQWWIEMHYSRSMSSLEWVTLLHTKYSLSITRYNNSHLSVHYNMFSINFNEKALEMMNTVSTVVQSVTRTRTTMRRLTIFPCCGIGRNSKFAQCIPLEKNARLNASYNMFCISFGINNHLNLYTKIIKH